MKAYSVIAAAFAAFAMGALHTAPAVACTDGKCQRTTASAAGKPLQLTKQKSTRAAVKEPRRKRARAPKKAPVEQTAAPAALETASDTDIETPLPVVVVRTTRERGDEQDEQDVDVVSPNEFSDIDRAASVPSSSSLLTSTIARYLGRPDLADEVNSPPVVNTEDFSAEAKEAFAADPEPQKPVAVALEYILMTFGGALAAASAIRLFAV